MHGAKSRENQEQAYKSSLPVESHGMQLIPPVTMYDTTLEVLFTKEAH